MDYIQEPPCMGTYFILFNYLAPVGHRVPMDEYNIGSRYTVEVFTVESPSTIGHNIYSLLLFTIHFRTTFNFSVMLKF